MKLLWLCNSIPGVIRAHKNGKPASAVNWVDHVLSDLRERGFQIRVLCRGSEATGILDETCSYRCFGLEASHEYHTDLEKLFRVELRSFQPDVIHSWGVEYDHCLAMVNAAEAEGMLPKMVASIQGLCAVLAEHYTDGIPKEIADRHTFRDLMRRDNIRAQQQKFVLRGRMEKEAVMKLSHVIGRTSWDRKHTREWNPGITYHFCNETLRKNYYSDRWSYETCKKHRIFAPGSNYPIKGFHLLLEAFSEVLKVYPDATLAVPGRAVLADDLKSRLQQGSYEAYLADMIRKKGLKDKIYFLGSLTAERMKDAFLESNLFVLPSAMENSPNTLGEAMLLGVPCVASDVGGVRDLLEEGREGLIYPSLDTAKLAEHIKTVFAMEDKAEEMGGNARIHARKTHDPKKNLQDLIAIYESLQ